MFFCPPPFMKVATRGPASLIDRTAGTNIGDMTGNGGLAAVFDGNTSQGNSSAARKTSSEDGYVGKTFAVPTALDFVVAFGTNNGGFYGGTGNANTVTLTLYGKQGAAPVSIDDGSTIGTISFPDSVNEPRTINSTDTATYWDHAWVRVQYDGTGADLRFAELEMTGWQ